MSDQGGDTGKAGTDCVNTVRKGLGSQVLEEQSVPSGCGAGLCWRPGSTAVFLNPDSASTYQGRPLKTQTNCSPCFRDPEFLQSFSGASDVQLGP